MPDAEEVFIEYGVSHRNEPPRQGSWTPDWEIAARDAAYREKILGQDEFRPIVIMERTTTITSTNWRIARRPEVEPIEFSDIKRQTEVNL